MTEDLVTSTWWRFERYEVDELYIRPAAGAELVPYDPWQQNREGLARRKNHEPPYVTLARLGSECLSRGGRLPLGGRLAPRASHLPGLQFVGADDELLAAIRDWSESNGPLGMLLAGLQAFTTAPRYRPGRDPGPYARDRALAFPWARTYELSAGQWRPYDTEIQDAALARPWQAQDLPMPDDTAPESIERAFQANSLVPLVPSPSTALRRAYHAIGAQSSWYLEPLRGWWRYFPALTLGDAAFAYPEPLTDEFWRRHHEPPDTTSFDFPSPSSEEFWRNYAEPLEEFCRHAMAFSAALAGLQRAEEDAYAKSVLEPMRQVTPRWPGLQHEPDADEETLRRLLSFVTPDLLPDPAKDGRYRARWSSPTLLSTMAFMAYSDMVGGGRIAYCKRNRCGRVFLAHRDDQVYCSARCKATQKKRCQRHPELLEEALKLHRQGLANAEIASRLFLGEKRVAAWVAQAGKGATMEQREGGT
jgi:hypothetical protein